MKVSLFNSVSVTLVGTLLCGGAGFGIFLGMIQPTMSAISAAQVRITAAEPDATPEKRQAANDALKVNTAMVQQVKDQWDKTDKAIMPRYDVSNRFVAWKQYSYEMSQYLGPDLERWIPQTGVMCTDKFPMSPPPASPNAIPTGLIAIPLGTITVEGDFRHILTHILKWKDFNRLVLIDKLALSGNSPNMSGSYDATVYIIPQNAETPGKPIPLAGAGGGVAGGSPSGRGGF